MDGLQLLNLIVKQWNSLPKPASENSVNQTVREFVTKFEEEDINVRGLRYADCTDMLAEFEDPDQHLISFMVSEIGKKLNLTFLAFIGHFTEGLVFLDYERDPVSSLRSYKMAEGLWFDDVSEQYFYGNIASAHIEVGEWDDAVERLNHALEMAESRGDKESIGIYYQNKGVALRGKGELEIAKACYEKALKISEENNDQFLARRRANLRAIKIDLERQSMGHDTDRFQIYKGPEEPSIPISNTKQTSSVLKKLKSWFKK